MRLLLLTLLALPFATRAAPVKPEPDAPLFTGELADDAAAARAIREHYTKFEFRIPMRDGVKLTTEVYAPKDASRAWPIMLTRTPYSAAPYGEDNYPAAQNERALRRFAPSRAFLRDGWIFVHQDVRGRLDSEGTFVDVRPRAAAGGTDEATDAWDTVDWLVKHVPNNNGKVGVWGISYPGFYAAQAAVDAHPAVKAVSPQAPVTEWFLGDDFHHNGAFFLQAAFDFYASFGKARPVPVKKSTWGFEHDRADAYDFFLALGPLANANTRHFHGEIAFWNDLAAHPNRDAWWQARDPRPSYRKVKPAVLTVGGLFDAEDLWGTVATYRAFEDQSPGAQNALVLGPWQHGGWARTEGDALGDQQFGQKTSLFYREQIELPFFAHHLKGRAAPEAVEAWVFETGTDTWQRHAVWPPAGSRATALYLGPRGSITTTAPAEETGEDTYVSDPAKPVPYTAKLGHGTPATYMTEDQRFASRRPDVLAWSTAPFEADVAIAGPIEVSLWVTTTGTDADFVVKLVDVLPEDVADPEPNPTGLVSGGAERLVRAEVMRGRFRDGFEVPRPFTPGAPALVRFTLPDVAHAFRAGHRLMVQVQSSWFPLVDRNPQTFVDPFKATEADFQPATMRILRTKAHPSSLRVLLQRGSFGLK